MDTDWPATVIWWHAYPLRFVDAEPRLEDHHGDEPAHRLARLTGWLDYLIELGANGLLLALLFASTSHGYDTLDHYRVDPRLGDDADFDELVRQTKDRGIRLALDGVFNHVSQDHEIVGRAQAGGPDSEDGQWVTWDHGYVIGFEGNLDLVELNLQHPPVADYVVDVMNHWLDRGVDGWRLDAAYAAGPAAWAPIVKRVKAAHPEAWIVAEVMQEDYLDFVARSGVDSVTQYELWKAVWSSLNDPNLHELEWTLGRHATFCRTFRPQTFLSNHDVTRIASELKDSRHLPLAVALLMVLPGIPSVYAGDEQGFTGTKLDQPHGDDAVRPPFPETPAGLSPLGAEVLAVYQELIGLRRDRAWLVEAQLRTDEVSNTTLAVHLAKDERRLTLALNAGDEAATVAGRPVAPHAYRIDT